MKKSFAILFAVLLLISSVLFVGCKKKGDTEATKPSQKPTVETKMPTHPPTEATTPVWTEPETEAPSTEPVTEAQSTSDALYDAAVAVLSSSGASGYTICNCQGTGYNQILLAYGSADDRTFILRSIRESDIGGIATIASGGGYSACIDYNTGQLALARDNGDGTVSYGAVTSDGNSAYANLSETYNSMQDVPGMVISFSDINDYTMLSNYT